jgi:membrane-bound ClpP family serine protease
VPTYPVVVDDFWANAAFSITPTIVVGLIFWFAMRAIIRADRAERQAYTDIEAEERARFEKLYADPHE